VNSWVNSLSVHRRLKKTISIKVVRERWAGNAATWARIRAAKASNDRLEELIRAGATVILTEEPISRPSEEVHPSEASTMTTVVDAAVPTESAWFRRLLAHASQVDEEEGLYSGA